MVINNDKSFISKQINLKVRRHSEFYIFEIEKKLKASPWPEQVSARCHQPAAGLKRLNKGV